MGGERKPVGLVLIHGAGKNLRTYYQEFVASLTEVLGTEPPFIATWWSDLCNPLLAGPRAKRYARVDSPEAEAFRLAFLREMGLDAIDGREAAYDIRYIRCIGETITNLLETIDDAVQYLFNAEMRVDIQARLTADLEEASRRFDRTILFSHSMGCLISFDVLRQYGASYNVGTWFSAGCPLAKLAKLRVISTDVGQIPQSPLVHWENLYDTGDVVASALRGTFHFGIHDVRVENGAGITRSHDYCRNPAVVDMVAAALQGKHGRLPLWCMALRRLWRRLTGIRAVG